LLGKKTDGLLENLRILKLIFVYYTINNSVYSLHEAPHTVAQLYGLSLIQFFTKMSFKILKFSNRLSLFFQSIQLYLCDLGSHFESIESGTDSCAPKCLPWVTKTVMYIVKRLTTVALWCFFISLKCALQCSAYRIIRNLVEQK
jgi:hypothetical protein